MTADGSGGTAWCIQEHEGKRLPGFPVPQVGTDQLGGKAKTGEIGGEALKADRITFDGCDVGATDQERRGFASGSCAQVKHPRPAYPIQEPRWQRGGKVLYPPLAIGKTVKTFHARAGVEPPDATGQCGRRWKTGKVWFAMDIERCEFGVAFGDLADTGLTIGITPAVPEPIRRVEPCGIQTLQQGLTLARHPTQHRIDQALEVPGLGIGRRQSIGSIHRGMAGNIEEQEFTGTGEQDLEGCAGTMWGKRLRCIGRNQGVELAKAAQGLAGDGPGKSRVAGGKRIGSQDIAEGGIEGLMLAQHRAEGEDRGLAGGKAGRTGHGPNPARGRPEGLRRIWQAPVAATKRPAGMLVKLPVWGVFMELAFKAEADPRRKIGKGWSL